VDVHYIFHPSTIWSDPVYGARAEKPLQNADFAMKQTNICRLSGDIIIIMTKTIVFAIVMVKPNKNNKILYITPYPRQQITANWSRTVIVHE